MTRYSLKELATILNCKHYLTRDRFIHYFTVRYGWKESVAAEAYKLFLGFPRLVNSTVEETQSQYDIILPKVIELVDEMMDSFDMTPKNIRISDYCNKEFQKIIYKENDVVSELIINIYNPSDIITYAELLKRKPEVLAMLALCTTAHGKPEGKSESRDIQIFEGDIFNTYDQYWGGGKSNIYVAFKNDTFKKLLYIKGKGYLINDELNIEEERSYNSHALTMNEWAKIGNIYINMDILSDVVISKEEK